MKKIFLNLTVIAFLPLLIASCGNNNNKENGNNQSSNQTVESQNPKEAQLPAEFLGNYHGIQPSYFLKNQYGDDMVIRGNKVSVPSHDFKFLLKENSIVSLQQTNLEDNSRFYSDGTIKILSNDAEYIKLECSLIYDENSKQTYSLTIKKSDKKGTCTGNNDEPEFTVEINN